MPWRDLPLHSVPRLAAGAHNALGARIAEETGFDLVWASGFELSTSRGVPDASVLGMMDHLHAAEELNAATSLPVLCDCDAGFGDSATVEILVRRYEAAGLAGVCIEDKRHPKLNSLLETSLDALERPDEFARKLEVAAHTRRNSDFGVIARSESLAVGAGLEDALARAHMYVEAGCDALVVHTRDKSNEMVFEFLQRWKLRSPVILIPTTYPLLADHRLSALGVSLVIYANHGLRASVRAMKNTLGCIVRDRSAENVQDVMCPLSEVLCFHQDAYDARGTTPTSDDRARTSKQ